MKINYSEYTKKIVEIEVPHSIYGLFEYEDQDYTQTNIHYGVYELSRLIEDMEDENWDLEDEDREFIMEAYKLCEDLFCNKNVDEVHFLDEEY